MRTRLSIFVGNNNVKVNVSTRTHSKKVMTIYRSDVEIMSQLFCLECLPGHDTRAETASQECLQASEKKNIEAVNHGREAMDVIGK